MRTPHLRLFRTAELRALGWTKGRMRAAVEEGRLVRLRPGAYARAGIPGDVADAGRVLGRLTGVSALPHLGVFSLASDRLHVHVPPSASRLPAIGRPLRLHRRTLLRTPHPSALLVEPLDAVFDAVMSQPPRAGVATIDSALHTGVLRRSDLDDLFAGLPRRFRRLRRLLDQRAESGPESLVRLMLRSLGCAFDCQVTVVGVERVDFLVDGWLIVECDSRAHHSSWEAQRTDRRRDLEAAKRGLVTFRVIAEDILGRPEHVRAALAGVLSARPSARKHGELREGVLK